MLVFFRVLLDRLKALLLGDAALDLEAQIVVRVAERKAELLRKAAAFEAEGLEQVGADLRRHAEALDLARPLGASWPALTAVGEDNSPTSQRPEVSASKPTNEMIARLPEPPSSPAPTRRSGRRGG